MAQNGEAQDLMGYESLAQEALRGVVRAALRRAGEPPGLPGAHHLYISFKTRAAGVSIPPELVEKYPDEMTIVLQHQFWDLAPGETFFAVTLQFNNQPKNLSVPYAAVTRFYDPSVQFLLQFEVAAEALVRTEAPGVLALRPKRGPVEAPAATPERERAVAPAKPRAGKLKPIPASPKREDDARDAGGDPKDGGEAAASEDAPKIVSLDQFRKK